MYGSSKHNQRHQARHIFREMRKTSEVAAVPISGIVPTGGRADVLDRTLKSLRAQMTLPAELIIVDASCNEATRAVVARFSAEVEPAGCHVLWEPATLR